ncbi:hypothetical protein [Calothrix sp. NIES-3974]|uniref:hypothetical protein n=1 Tax=Calothrix sp. NIES-3974 TaxID=2005462 RepID=UPI000B61617B|nr:hypothetical protein [Calothrix sp. NIES-3974]BAZ04649.1 hypothetical protein NIES3974_12920 [Calothrix sp. NIES-3974]
MDDSSLITYFWDLPRISHKTLKLMGIVRRRKINPLLKAYNLLVRNPGYALVTIKQDFEIATLQEVASRLPLVAMT